MKLQLSGTDFYISEYTDKYRSDFITLADDGLGTGYINSYIDHLTDDNNFCFIITNKDEALAAFLFGHILDFKHTAQLIRVLPDTLISDFHLEPNEFSVNLDGCVVNPKYRGKGLSTQIINYTIDKFCTNYNLFVVLLWMRGGDEIPAASLLANHGFSFYSLIPQYWHDCPDLVCNYCNQPKCTCDCSVYYKIKGDSEK